MSIFHSPIRDDFDYINELRYNSCGLCGHHRRYPAGRTVGGLTFPDCDCDCHRNINWVLGE